jgi:Bacterial archaeo-eukaryotic release factor family 7
MSEIRVDSDIDVISVADVMSLGTAQGPCVSMFMPTHRSGRETLQGPVRLRNLINTARGELSGADVAETIIENLVAPLESLVDDHEFWQRTADGLALFSAPGRFERYRVSLSLAEEVVVAASFRVRAVLSLMSRDETFFVLSLSQNAVQLFEATRSAITMLDLGSTATSMDEALALEDHESQLQLHSTGGGSVKFHGHGAGAELDKTATQRFLRAVDRGVCERLGDAHGPLVLACVDYYLPLFQSVTRYSNVFDTAVTGNPEHRSPTELHADALRLIDSDEDHPGIDRYRVGIGAGTTVSAIADVVTRAREGRVDTLLVTDVPPVWGRVAPDTGTVSTSQRASIDDEDLIDRAVFDTLATGGEVFVTDVATLGTATGVAATLRY